MKKLIFLLCAVVIMVLSGCSKYNDGPLSNRINDLEKRVATLEELCKQINTNVSSIQTLVNAIKDNDVITSITPLKYGNEEVGYTISFSKSPAITIYHGKDGQNGNDGLNGNDGADGTTPVIGVKEDIDGHYYWTLNGEWLIDNNGHKILAEGVAGNDGQNGNDGKDGITPQFKIENGNWYISLDNGQIWEYVGQATGADGKDGQDGKDGNGGDAMFSDINTSHPEYVIFTLSNGTIFTLPRQVELTISFDEESLVAMKPNSTRTIGYTISGNTSGLHVEVLSSGNVRAKISDNSSATGTLTINTGASIDEYDKVILLASNGRTTVMSSLSFEKSELRVTSGTSYEVDARGGTLDITIETNTEYTISIPEGAASWISTVVSRAMREEIISLNIAANEEAIRTASINLIDKSGNVAATFRIIQNSKLEEPTIPADMEIAFPDEDFRAYVLENFDLDKDGVISQAEAKSVTAIDVENKFIFSLEGIQYFAYLTTLNCADNKLNNFDISHNTALTYLYCRNNPLTSLDVSKNTALTNLYCDWNQLTNLDVSKNTALTNLECSSNKLTNLDVSKNTALTRLSCSSNQLTDLDVSKNTALTYLSCGWNQFTSLDVSKNTALTGLYCIKSMLTSLDISNNTALTILNCSRNQLTSLDISKNTVLTTLICGSNKLTNLDVSKHAALTLLSCGWNQLTSLDVSKNTALTNLECPGNQLTKLDVSKNIALTYLDCSSNQLTNLDVSKTNLGNSSEEYPLDCSDVGTQLSTLTLKKKWEINGITINRSDIYIPEQTKIIYVD